MYTPGLDEYNSDEELESVLLFKGYPPSLLCFATFTCFFFVIIGIPGNLITILALAMYKKVHNATAFFIIHLSISDLLYCCIILPITSKIFWEKHLFGGKAMCRFHAIFNFLLTSTGVFTIVAITINRYIMVAHPNLYPRLYTNRNILIMIIAIWVGATTMLLPIIIEIWGRFSLDPEVGFCTVIPDKNGYCPKKLIIIMGFAFPCTVIILCYSRIFYIVKKSTKTCNTKVNAPVSDANQETSVREDSSEKYSQTDVQSYPSLTRFKKALRTTIRARSGRPKRPTRKDKKLQSMIFTIILTFFACHLPIMIAKLISGGFSTHPYENIMGYMMLYTTTSSNPIIYVVLSSEYRKAYKNLFRSMGIK